MYFGKKNKSQLVHVSPKQSLGRPYMQFRIIYLLDYVNLKLPHCKSKKRKQGELFFYLKNVNIGRNNYYPINRPNNNKITIPQYTL